MHLTLELTRTDRPDEAFIAPEGETGYVLRTEGGGAETATLDWSPALYADLDAVRRPGRDPAVVQRMGNRLRRFVAPAGWTSHEVAIAAAAQKGEPVMITLRASAAEVYGLPWELLTLKSSGQHLGELPTVLIRYAWPDSRTSPEEPSPLPEGGRILFGWSASSGGLPLDAHLAAIRGASGRAHHGFDPARDVLDHLSLDKLAGALDAAASAGEIVTVLHLLCHGGEVGQSFGLCWDADDGSGDKVIVDAGRLRQILAPHAGRVRLVVLAACDSGNAGAVGNHLGSVAQNLHQAGVQAVIASRFPLSAEGSGRFAQTFYEALLGEPSSVERAFLAGRHKLARDPASLDWAAITLHARPEDGDDTRPVTVRPYRGLLAFQAAHSRFFVGRDAERDETVNDLAALRDGGKPRFLVVAGASGTGKSSVVLAGVVPALIGEPGEPARPDEIEVLQRTVGRLAQLLGDKGRTAMVQQALHTLERETAALAGATGGWEVFVMRPGADPEGALSATLSAATAGRKSPDAPWLLVVDQLEEIFTHVADPAARQAFAARLWALSRASGGPSVIVTLRVDFLGQCGEIVLEPDAGLRLDSVAYDEAHRVFVAQMKPAQMREVIEEPARRVGLALEAGLAARMLADVGAEPGALPLLEYTLDRLWQKRREHVLTTACYEEMGGVFGALSSMADRVLAELTEPAREAARKLLPRLVGIGESGAGDTRQRVPVARLLPRDPEARARSEEALGRFVEARLLTRAEEGGEAVVEVAHEALIRRWSRLRDWLSEDRGRLAEVAKIERWAADFSAQGALLQGAHLGYARQVREQYADGLGEGALALIAASEDAERAHMEAEQRRLAAERRRLRRIAVGAVVAATVMLVLGTIASVARYRAQEAEGAALSAQRIAAATRLADHDQFAWASEVLLRDEVHRDAHWASLAQRVLVPLVPRMTFQGRHGQVLDVAVDAGAERVATAFADGKVELWSFGGVPIGTLDHGPSRVNAVAFRPDGALLLTGDDDGTVQLWDVTGGGPFPLTFSGTHPSAVTAAVTAVAWSPDPRLFATASADGTAALWDATHPEAPAPIDVLVGHEGAVRALSFDDRGERLATASLDCTARVWSVDGRRAPIVVEQGAPVYGVRFDHGGTRIITAGQDHVARVWSAEGAGPPRMELRGHSAAVGVATWSLNDRWIVTGSDDNTARLWSGIDGSPVAVLRHHTSTVSAAVALGDRDGDLHVVLGSWDGSASLWDRKEMKRPVFRQAVSGGPEDRRRIIAWSGDDERAVSSTGGGRVEIWTASSDEQPAAALDAMSEIRGAALDHAGDRLFLVGREGAVLWDLRRLAHPVRIPMPEAAAARSAVWGPGGRLATLVGSKAQLWDVGERVTLKATLVDDAPLEVAAWSPDGQRLATASGDTAKLWDVLAPAKPLVLDHPRSIRAVAFSPDGASLVVASGTATYLWRTTGERIGLVDHEGQVTSADFDPTGAYIVVAIAAPDIARVCEARQPFLCPLEIPLDEDAKEAVPRLALRGGELRIARADGASRSYPWPTTQEKLADQLRGRTAACLPASVRSDTLDEDEATATRAADACTRARAKRP